jgi:hypothetical protein
MVSCSCGCGCSSPVTVNSSLSKSRDWVPLSGRSASGQLPCAVDRPPCPAAGGKALVSLLLQAGSLPAIQLQESLELI